MGPMEWNARLLRYLVGKFPFHGYFPDPEKIWHECRAGKKEVTAREEFQTEVIEVKYTQG